MDELDLVRAFRREDTASADARAGARAALDDAIASTGPAGGIRPLHRRTARRWLAVTSVAAVVAGIATVAVVTRPSSSRDPQALQPAYAEALAKFPADTASDIVSYADRVAVVTAVAVVELPDNAPPARAAAGEGTIYRRITFRVDETLWERSGALPSPPTFQSIWWGWVLHDHQRTKFVAQGAPWVEIGSRYVMPLAFDEGAFVPIQPFAVFPFEDSVVTLADRQETELGRQLNGATRDVVSRVFAQATPDEVAARHMDLPPSRRLEAVRVDSRS